MNTWNNWQKKKENLREISANLSSQDMRNHSILADKTVTYTLKPAFSNLKVRAQNLNKGYKNQPMPKTLYFWINFQFCKSPISP